MLESSATNGASGKRSPTATALRSATPPTSSCGSRSHIAAVVLVELGCDAVKVSEWMQQLTARVAAKPTAAPVAA
jgi:hypothetical protein